MKQIIFALFVFMSVSMRAQSPLQIELRADSLKSKSLYEEAYLLYAQCKTPSSTLKMGELIYQSKIGSEEAQQAFRPLKSLAKKKEQYQAQHYVGYMLREGIGTKKNTKEALKYYKKAADYDYDQAEAALGYMYAKGIGVSVSNEEAVKWYKKAALHGNDIAQNNIGYMYENGLGVEKSEEEALNAYKIAAEKGNVSGQYNVGRLYYVNQKNYNEALKWFRPAAEKGYASAQYYMGVLYENGNGVKKDTMEAIKWYKFAANQGDEKAKKQHEILLNTVTSGILKDQ